MHGARERFRGGRHPVQFGCLGLPRTPAPPIRRFPTRILAAGPTGPTTTLVVGSHSSHDDLSSSACDVHDTRCTSPTRERSATARITDVPPLLALSQDPPCEAPPPLTPCEATMQIRG